MYNSCKQTGSSRTHLVLLLTAVLTTALTLGVGVPAHASAPPPQNPGCETYGCVYEECPQHHTRRGTASCEQVVRHETLEDTPSRTLIAVRWPEHYAPDRRDMWNNVAYCESTWRWAINNGNGYHGGLQFYPNTWNAYGGGEYASYAFQATPEQQISIAERVAYHGWHKPDGSYVKPQGKGAWPRCGRTLSAPA